MTGGQVDGTGPFCGGFCSAFSLPHCHHHGPQGNDPYPAEGQPGCPSQKSPKCPRECDSDAKAPHNDFSSDKYTFSGGTQQASGEEGIMKAIYEGGPVETAFTVYSDFANYVSGIYHHVSGGVEGGHAVRIVGWGEENGQKYWKVANSWNPYWGEKGYFRIKKGNNECGIEDGVTFSSADAKWSKKSDVEEEPLTLTLLDNFEVQEAPDTSHYEDPKPNGCQSGEEAVQIQGIKGDFCSPPCKDGTCPTDVPSGVTAKPQCALQTSTGQKYCALLCQPGEDDAQCGTNASCKSIQGAGICTYDD